LTSIFRGDHGQMLDGRTQDAAVPDGHRGRKPHHQVGPLCRSATLCPSLMRSEKKHSSQCKKKHSQCKFQSFFLVRIKFKKKWTLKTFACS
jgi:hypothetical protein